MGQVLLQIGAASFYYKLGQFNYYKSGQVLLQIRAAITNQGDHYYKLGQLLQIGAIFITNWGITATLEECEFVFSIICVSETWCPNIKLQNNSNLSLTGFDSVPYKRSKKSRGGGVWIFIKKNLSCKIRKELSEFDEHKEIPSLEPSFKNSSNMLLNCCYKLPKGDNDKSNLSGHLPISFQLAKFFSTQT